MDHYQAVLTYRNIMISCLVFLMLLFTFDLRALTEVGGETPLVRLESKQIEVSEEAILRLILVSAPGGLRRYNITVSVRNNGIARIRSAAKGAAMDRLLFQVLEQTEKAIEFRALSLFETRILPGAQYVTLAEINLVGVKEGKTWMDAKVTAFIDDEGNNVAPVVESGLLEVVAASSRNSRIGVSASAAQDVDGDDSHEDIHGTEMLTLENVIQFAFNVDSPLVQTQVDRFDFDGDGDADFDDAMALAKLAKVTPSAIEPSTPRLFDHSNAVRKAISESGSSLIQQPGGGNRPAGQGGYSEHTDSHYQEEALFTHALQLKQRDPEGSFGKENPDGRITDLTLLNHDPLTVAIEFENTGSVILRPDGRLEIRDITGETIRSIPIEAFSIFPGKKRLLNCIDEGAKLPPGKYLALGIIDSQDGVLIAGQRMFEVK